MRRKCVWSSIFATTVRLNIICGWFGPDFSHEYNLGGGGGVLSASFANGP